MYHAAFSARRAALIALAAVIAIYALQFGFYAAGLSGLVAAAAADGAIIMWLAVYARDPARLGLRRVRVRFVLAAILVGGAAWYLDLRLVTWLQPPGNTKPLEQAVEQSALGPTLLAVALAAPLAEELVFRGVLARGLATALRPWVAVVISAAAFALYHVIPPQMVAAFPLGLALGYFALRADSIVPSLVVHAVNNTVVTIVARDEVRGLDGALERHPIAALVASLAVVGLGLSIAAARG